jgi:hypothetical protein
MVCPISAAFAIQDALPHVKLCITPDGGHSFSEPGTKKRFKQMTRVMRSMQSMRKTQKKMRE